MDENNAQAVVEFSVEDGGGDAVVMGVIDGLSVASGIDPLDMEPVQSSIDTDALASLFASQSVKGPSKGGITVTLCIDDYEVTIKSHGRIYVSDRETDQPTPTD